jgi:hypothetical protein
LTSIGTTCQFWVVLRIALKLKVKQCNSFMFGREHAMCKSATSASLWVLCRQTWVIRGLDSAWFQHDSLVTLSHAYHGPCWWLQFRFYYTESLVITMIHSNNNQLSTFKQEGIYCFVRLQFYVFENKIQENLHC